MPPRLLTPGYRVRVVKVVAGVLAAAGATSIIVGLSAQHHAPEPPVTTAASSLSDGLRPAVPNFLPPSPTIVGPVLKASLPVSIAIPAIDVSSSLLQLGRTDTGALAVPPPGPTYDEAGWYRYSPTPGSLGPAVIAGHVDSAAEGPSVFFRLGALKPHDTIRITRADGSIAVFAVDDVSRFHKTAFPTNFVYGNTDHAALRLITCGGVFDSNTGHYLDNIIVRASLQS